MTAGADAFFDKSTQIEEFAHYVNSGSPSFDGAKPRLRS